MSKKTVVKVCINCQTCKMDILKAVTKLEGIDELTIDAGKGTLTVTGEVDPVLIIKRLRKIKKAATIDSVGLKKPPEEKEKKKLPEEKEKKPEALPPCCNFCQPQTMIIGVPVYDDYGYNGCFIL